MTITDSFARNLDTAKSRVAANLRDLGEDEGAVENVRTCADLAGPLLFLASKASDFYTGHILYADGGYTAG